MQDPLTPSRQSFDIPNGADVFSSGGMGNMMGGNGLGNLADELADALSD